MKLIILSIALILFGISISVGQSITESLNATPPTFNDVIKAKSHNY